MTMTPAAKSALARTIRGASGSSATNGGLRQRLLAQLHDATESAYLLSVRAQDAGLNEAAAAKRARFAAWIAEQERCQGPAVPLGDKVKNPGNKAKKPATEARTAADFRREAEKQAAYTWLNRVIVLRLMEAAGLRRTPVVTGGWESAGYKDFRSIARGLISSSAACGDETEGYAYLLGLVFEELATELPGIFGSAGVADLVPMPAATLRMLVEALDDDALASCWTDDMTLGWVYQYWNDPERKRLDDKINAKSTWGSGKIEPHEIASKTQMFTERYMVDWLLQNSLAPMWLAMCKQHGWVAEVEADGTLDRLEARRVDWRKKRDAGEVALTELMPLHSAAERRWAYYVPQPLSQSAVQLAPASVRDLKLLDPAVGSGHFLMVAFELLVALYHEEARHRGEVDQPQWSEQAIVERILEHNLHGIDLDPRAVQIAAAALWLKAQGWLKANAAGATARPRQLNLVAATLRLASLADDDPALLELRREVESETGIPAELTDALIGTLAGADHLGSLLKVDSAVDDAIAAMAGRLGKAQAEQGHLFDGFRAEPRRLSMTPAAAKASLLQRLEGFLAKHTAGDDLGLRLRGEQLAAGVRLMRLVKEGSYDLVVANPPYQGTSKMADAAYVTKHYPLGKADLYAAFLLRGLELVREGGVSAMLTMRNWLFIKQYAGLRKELLSSFHLTALGDFEVGAFEEISGVVVSVSASVLARTAADSGRSLALKLTINANEASNGQRTQRKRAATRCHAGRHEFDAAALKVVPEWPLVYWWEDVLLKNYRMVEKLGERFKSRKGTWTSDNSRFLRFPHEVVELNFHQVANQLHINQHGLKWLPYVGGAKGERWLDTLSEVIDWRLFGLALKVLLKEKHNAYPQGTNFFFRRGIAFSQIGSSCSARAHRYPGTFGGKGSSVFPDRIFNVVCMMNTQTSVDILSSLNPGVGFELGDVARLPILDIRKSDRIFELIESNFTTHESHREPSVEFTQPGPSPWRHAQAWAQLAVDRADGAPLPPYKEQLDPEPATDHLSYALGVALGRFDPAKNPDFPADQRAVYTADPAADTDTSTNAMTTPGLLFLNGTLPPGSAASGGGDSLGEPRAAFLHTTWADHGATIDPGRDLRTYLRLKFFGDVHKGMYDNRPIHWPLCSADKTFVAWVNIHQMTGRTLRNLHAFHLAPALTRLDGELDDLQATRQGADAKAARQAEARYDVVLKAQQELTAFIEQVTQCADRGPPPTDPNPKKCPPRAVDAAYEPVLDDGVMINAAALWPLLSPLWDKPKIWWTELCLANKGKDYDWSHLAMGYWPARVDAKCRVDPSLGVAHGCFWAYHPAKAWAWELRLQEEIGLGDDAAEAANTADTAEAGDTTPWRGRIEEGAYGGDAGDAAHRAAYLRDHPAAALAAVQKEALRRLKKLRKPVYEAELKRLIADKMAPTKAKRLAKKLAEQTTLPSLTLLETGLWSGHAEACRALEQAVTKKQGAPFRLLAPDGPARRAADSEARAGGERAGGERATPELNFGDPS